MKVIILAGGMGTRLAEYTKTIPKPMVTIGGTPIIRHIINIYFKFGFKDYYIWLNSPVKITFMNHYANDTKTNWTIRGKNTACNYCDAEMGD